MTNRINFWTKFWFSSRTPKQWSISALFKSKIWFILQIILLFLIWTQKRIAMKFACDTGTQLFCIMCDRQYKTRSHLTVGSDWSAKNYIFYIYRRLSRIHFLTKMGVFGTSELNKYITLRYEFTFNVKRTVCSKNGFFYFLINCTNFILWEIL